MDDAHYLVRPLLPLDLCEAWISVKARDLTAESIMHGIRDGHFYSSNGPEIRGIDVNRREIRVYSTPVRSIAFISDGGHGENNTVNVGYLQESVYTVRGTEAYVRIEITDWNGRKAWANPIYVEP